MYAPFPIFLCDIMRGEWVRTYLTRRGYLWEAFSQVFVVGNETHGRELVIREMRSRLALPHWWRARVTKECSQRQATVIG